MPERFAIQFLPSAARQLENVPIAARGPIVEAIGRLGEEPRPDGAKLLSGVGAERIWRMHIGSYRILYRVADARLVILVVRIADRREVYNPTTLRRLLKQIRGAR